MSVSRFVAYSACLVALSVPTAARAQGAPPMPTPGPEHAILKMDVGTWDAAVEVSAGPGMDAMKSKGVEVNTLGCGGLCLITDFKGELMPGMAFHGHGTTTWDVTRKKYRTGWTDSMSQGLSLGEVAWDPKAKKMSGTMEGPDASGQVMKMRTNVDYSSANSRVMTAYAAGPDGKEMQVMRITYTKRK